jgi:hypothetical protein
MSARLAVLLFSAFLLITFGCGAGHDAAGNGAPPNAQKAVGGQRVLACSVITSEEIQAVQGEALNETKGSDSTGEGLAVSHCVYLLPTYVKSLSLDVLRADQAGRGSDSIEKFWESRFRRRGTERGEEDERERGEEEEEEEGGAKPRPVEGIGEEAFWVGGRAKGVLYVREKGVVMTLSLGGAEDEATKIEKSKTLLLQALKRIN